MERQQWFTTLFNDNNAIRSIREIGVRGIIERRRLKSESPVVENPVRHSFPSRHKIKHGFEIFVYSQRITPNPRDERLMLYGAAIAREEFVQHLFSSTGSEEESKIMILDMYGGTFVHLDWGLLSSNFMAQTFFFLISPPLIVNTPGTIARCSWFVLLIHG